MVNNAGNHLAKLMDFRISTEFQLETNHVKWTAGKAATIAPRANIPVTVPAKLERFQDPREREGRTPRPIKDTLTKNHKKDTVFSCFLSSCSDWSHLFSMQYIFRKWSHWFHTRNVAQVQAWSVVGYIIWRSKGCQRSRLAKLRAKEKSTKGCKKPHQGDISFTLGLGPCFCGKCSWEPLLYYISHIYTDI